MLAKLHSHAVFANVIAGALLAALVFAPAASAGPTEDYQAVRADYQADGHVTACLFTRQQLQNTKDNTPPDVATYDPNFVTEVDTEIRRWDSGGCKGAGAPLSGSGAPDTKDPRIVSMSLSSTVFRAAHSGPAVGAARARPVGTTVAVTLSEPSSVRFTVQRKAKGRKVGHKCKARTRKNGKRKSCTRWKAVRGSFTVNGSVGKTTFKFRGRVGGKRLKPGRYRLTGTATDPSKNTSVPKRKGFRIVR